MIKFSQTEHLLQGVVPAAGVRMEVVASVMEQGDVPAEIAAFGTLLRYIVALRAEFKGKLDYHQGIEFEYAITVVCQGFKAHCKKAAIGGNGALCDGDEPPQTLKSKQS